MPTYPDFDDIDKQFRAVCKTGDKEALKSLEARASLEGVWLDFFGGLALSAKHGQREMFDYCRAKASFPAYETQSFACLLQRVAKTDDLYFLTSLFGDNSIKPILVFPVMHTHEEKPLVWIWNKSVKKKSSDNLTFTLMVIGKKNQALDMLDFLEKSPEVLIKPSEILEEQKKHLLPLGLVNHNETSLEWVLKSSLGSVCPVVDPEQSLTTAPKKCYEILDLYGKIDSKAFASPKWITESLHWDNFGLLLWLLEKEEPVFQMLELSQKNKDALQVFLTNHPEYREKAIKDLPSVSGIPVLEKEVLDQGLAHVVPKSPPVKRM